MKRIKWNRKQVICLLSVLLVATIATVGIAVWLRQEKLEQLQHEALAELDRNLGQYDEQSIVLYGTSKAKAEELAKLYNAQLRITANGRFATLTLPEGTTIRDVYAMDQSRKYIADMAADYQVRISDSAVEQSSGERLPARPQYSVTDTDYALQTYLDYLNMGSAWSSYTGRGITVAVIDTGIDTDHPEFVGRISEYSYNATEDKIVKDYNDWSLIEDEVGHGTGVTGVIAAAMDGSGTVGIAPDVEIIVIKAECDSNGNFARTSDLVFGLYYAIERDVDVVNMSFGAYSTSNPFAEATQLAYDSDIVCVAAAGNEGTSSLCWPAADPKVIGVGALDGWELAYYSNYGENVDICAPGTTYTTIMGGSYGNMPGTSLSSPIVAGAIALLLQDYPYMPVDGVTQILYASGYDLGDLGRDWYYGFGALDVSALVLEQRCTITYDMLTDELENQQGLFIHGHTLQELPEPERLYAVFDGWYYDDTFTQEYNYYEDKFYGEVTLYAKWVNEDDGVPYTYVVLDDGTVEIRSYTGHRRYITIPDMIEGRVVSSIGDFAFANQTRLREVTLPAGLTHIGLYAFQNCANLVSIHIPERVTEIEEGAFSGNVRLSTVAFLGNSKLEIIGDSVFADCGRLERIELPASLHTINGSAFYGATALYEIRVQPGNTTYKSVDGVLFNLSGSTLVAFPAAWGSSYVLPEDTQYIGAYAFAFARLKQVDLSNVVSIDMGGFIGAELETLTIPDCVISLGDGVFAYNRSLNSVQLGRGLTAISPMSFMYCGNLKQITIPNGITVINGSAFLESGLESVVFEENSSLIGIGSGAFAKSCLSQIDIPASVLEIGPDAFLSTPLCRVGVAEDSVLQTIGGSAFYGCGMLQEIKLPNSLRTIGDFAFQYSGLRTVTIPAGVTTLGDGAFSACPALTAVTVEEGNTVYHDMDGVVYTLDNTIIHTYPAGKTAEHYTIEAATQIVAPWAFGGAANLLTVELPEGLTQISEYGFVSCGNLQYVHIPDEVMQIGRYAFAYDWNLQNVSFGENAKLPRLSYGAFAHSGITNIRVPANVSTMAQGVFEGCRDLISITFAENSKLESISAYMFDGCTNLQFITFERGSALTSIQAHGLEGMDRLYLINFGDAKLTNIDNFAFRFCEDLEELILPETLTNIGRYAFYGCKKLSRLMIPESIEHIGSYAFHGTADMELYFVNESMPQYLDENWDYGTKGYYTGVSGVEESGDYRYAVLPSGNIAILKYLGSETHIDLTKLDLGGKITIIGGSAFEGSAVQTIVLPESLTAIQAEAFAYSSITSVTIPANVTFIGRSAFAHSDIAEVNFAKKAKLAVIEQYAFEGTKELTSVSLPESLTTMGTGAFLQSGLQQVEFAKKILLEEIPQKAFAETKLTEVVLPDSVTLVNHSAFQNVQTLKSLTFGKKEDIRLMSNAFYHTGLTSLHIPENVTYIGEYCFVALGDLTKITVDKKNPNYMAEDGLLLSKDGRKLIVVPAGRTGSLTVPGSVEEIGFGAFEESKLSEILFHADANILTFGYRAFFKANNITTITIPKSVVSIDYYAFAYCENLKEVIFVEGNRLKGIYEGAFLGCINLEDITIPDSIVEIADFAFYGCSKITKLPISENNQIKGIYDYAFAYTGLHGDFAAPESLIDIGNYAFLGCDFTKLTISDANKKELIIGIGAFEECNQLTEITLPFIGAGYEDEEISWFGYIFGAGAYEANGTYVPESLKTVTLTDGVSMIGIGGFANCTSLETINVPHSVSVLFNDAFKDTTARYELTNTIMTYWFDGWSIEAKLYSGYFGAGFTGELILADGVEIIGYGAFENCSGLTNIVIPDSVTSIGGSAFSNCSGLTSITIPNSVTSIGDGALSTCKALVNVIIPDSVTSFGSHVFWGCTNLESVTLPQTLTSIGGLTFCECKNLKSVIIPGTVVTIGASAFSECSSLENITLPEGLKTIEQGAFFNCSSLNSITIPAGVSAIGDDAFGNCSALYQVNNKSNLELVFGSDDNGSLAYHAKIMVDANGNKTYADNHLETADGFLFDISNNQYTLLAYLGADDTITLPTSVNGCNYEIYQFRGAAHVIVPDGVTAIGDYAFEYNTELETIIIPDSVRMIGFGAFFGCSNLKKIEIGSGVTQIGSVAFWGCKKLETITIPDGVVYIGNYAFEYCESLRSVVIPDSLTYIDYGLFGVCKALESVVIPDSVVSIAPMAFYDCSSLKSIAIPNGVTEIGGGAFSGCDSLLSITVPDSVIEIGAGAFPGSAEVKFVGDNPSYQMIGGVLYNAEGTEVIYVDPSISGEVVLQNGVITIRGEAFINCQSITSIVLPDSVNKIGYQAFRGCSSLEKINIPDGVEIIDYGAFWDCASLKSITIPNETTFYSAYAFYGCSSLKNVVLPQKLTTIEASAFDGCVSLEYVVIPESVTSIEIYAFQNCASLSSISIPDGVTTIGNSAFYDCTGLVSIRIPDSVTTIENYAFSNCENLLHVEFGFGVTSIGDSAFDGCSSLYYVTNHSDLQMTIGSEDHGSAAFYAKVLADANGQKRYAENYFETEDGFLFEMADMYILRAYWGELDTVTLPESVNGHNYVIASFRGAKHVIIPDTMTTIDVFAFGGCIALESVVIPESVENIGYAAFAGCGKLYTNPSYYQNGLVMIDGWLVDVDDDVTYLSEIAQIRGVVGGAYENCHLLKTVIWSGDQLPSNVETLYITKIDSNTQQPYDLPLTLKNIVICDTVDASDLRHCEWLFQYVTGVTIYVESMEADLRWNDNFPGWNNDNRVVYGDQWHWVNFYDENGKLISSAPCLNNQIIRLPVHEIAPDEKYTYEIIGWDLDGDGEVDSIPATSVVDIEAKPVVVVKERMYTVQFADASTGKVYHEVQLPYGSAITAPANPEKMGYDFVSWAGLYDGMTVIGDTVIYASWKHHGGGHEYAAPVWVDATCTEPGYNKHTCTICGEFYGTDYTEALGHTYQQTPVDATCTEEGYTLHSCDRCGYSYRDNFTPKADHYYGNWENVKLPSCADYGARHHKCKICGYREIDDMPAKGHKFKETDREEPTCDKKGRRKLECEDCGLHIEEELPKKNHGYEKRHGNGGMKAFVEDQFEDVFWEYEGDSVYFYACKDCGNVLSTKDSGEGRVGTASVVCRHRQTSWTTVREPDCAGFGLHAQICNNCGETVAVSVFGAMEHSYVTEVTEATCTQDGYTTHTCTGCGESYVTDYVPALEHDYVDGECTRCGRPEVMLGDVNGDGDVTTRDARLVLRYIAGLASDDDLDLVAADFNCDGDITTRDARSILRFVAGLG